MKVCHFSTQDVAGGGGGFQAAYRIHTSLRQAGCESKMLVARKFSSDVDVVEVGNQRVSGQLNSLMSRAILKILRKSGNLRTQFHLDFFSTLSFAKLSRHLKGIDVVHLHFISGFLTSADIENLASLSRTPVVWTLMDMEPLTGGCHYSGECEGYRKICGHCPQLGSHLSFDLSRWNWQRKSSSYRNVPITLVGGTDWIVERARESAFFSNRRVVKIPIGIDAVVFRPADRNMARERLGLPKDMRLILFGANNGLDKRKGFSYLVESLYYLRELLHQDLASMNGRVALVIAGSVDVSKKIELPFEVFYIGHLAGDDKLALAYQAADLFVSPSIEDAGPMMIPECMLSGTPVVAFNVGGAPDLINSMITGYLAKFKDAADLALGMYSILTLPELQMTEMQYACRQVALQEHSLEIQASRYANLYETLIR